jgi:c-di-GMP-related signal transduction protein
VAQARVRDVKPLRYVARQPIFDREEKVFGYELLFETGWKMRFMATPMRRRGQRWTGPC